VEVPDSCRWQERLHVLLPTTGKCKRKAGGQGFTANKKTKLNASRS
jgi:hypothetical protein